MILNTFKNKKNFLISNEKKARIQKEIDELLNLSDGIYSKIKENELGYYVKIIIDKTNIDKVKTEGDYFMYICSKEKFKGFKKIKNKK